MSQAEELLNSVSEEVSAHTHPVPDTDTYFIIDPITRRIENTNRKKSVVMQYDHNSERFTFELPRFVDGHDMLECTSVTVNVDNIEVVESDDVEVVEPRVNSDAPDMTDLRVHPNDPDKVISSWLISRNSTQLAGILSFHIEYKCVDSGGNVVYEWGTDTYAEIEVKARKKNGETVVAEYADVLEQWRSRIFGAGDSVMANIAAEGEAQVAAVKSESETQQEAVELKGVQTLDSIPDDYTEVNAMADEAVRSKGDAIVCEAAGESIVVKDSSNDHIRGLKLFGKSVQATTTGKNLFNHLESNFPKTMGGVTFTYNDGVICLNGICDSSFNLKTGTVELIDGIYTLSANNPAHNGNELALVQVYNYDTGLAITAMDKYVDTHISGALTAGTYECRIRVQNGVEYNNFKISPQLELGETATNYEPYTGGKPSPNPEYPQDIASVESPTVNVYGKNLCPPSAFNGMNTNGSANTYDPSSNTITMDVDSATSSGRYCAPCKNLIVGKPYTLSFDIRGTAGKKVTCGWNVGKLYVTLTNEYVRYSSTIIASHPSEAIIFYSYVSSGGGLLSGEFIQFANVQIEFGETATSYEPYKSVQTVAATRTFHGIPVTSGGNYTDSDGQQWICDEIDLDRGVYVKHISTVDPYDFIDKYCVSSDNSKYSDTIVRFDLGYALGCRVKEPVLSNRFAYEFAHGATTNIARAKECVSSHSTADIVSIFIDKNRLTSVDKEGFKAYLLDNKTTIQYALATPIETPLTAEEIVAFKTLRTNYPNTTILNDAGAHMSVKYNADTKLYVDNKISAAISAFLAEHQIG